MTKEEQNKVYDVVKDINIFEDLSEYKPTLCGTFPLGINVDGSDLDIIMEVEDFELFEERVKQLYAHYEAFKMKHQTIRNRPVIKANFRYKGFEFELFGQSQPVHEQYAYLHMIIEKRILDEHSHLVQEIIQLKKQGYKTEPAFCKVLDIKGDPYKQLIEYGKKMKFIS